MKMYIPIVVFLVVASWVIGNTDVNASVSSGPGLPESRLSDSGHLVSEYMFEPFLLTHKPELASPGLESPIYVHGKSHEKTDLRNDIQKTGSGQKLMASHWEHEEEDEEEQDEGEGKEEGEGFDRLWDVSNLG